MKKEKKKKLTPFGMILRQFRQKKKLQKKQKHSPAKALLPKRRKSKLSNLSIERDGKSSQGTFRLSQSKNKKKESSKGRQLRGYNSPNIKKRQKRNSVVLNTSFNKRFNFPNETENSKRSLKNKNNEPLFGSISKKLGRRMLVNFTRNDNSLGKNNSKVNSS